MQRPSIATALTASAMLFALAACSSTTPQATPPGAPAALVTHRQIPMQRDRTPSWMAPDAATNRVLLYVADLAAGDVYVYSYPAGKQVGKLTGFSGPTAVCAGRGYVWVLNVHPPEVLKYERGGTKAIATLPDTGYWPSDCAVDPKTGDLAVANVFVASEEGTPGGLMVFAKGQGKPKTFTDSQLVNVMYAAYDDAGNLFVDGFGNEGNNFALAELPAGKNALVNITTNAPIPSGATADLGWDGKHLAVGSAATDEIYQLDVTKTHAKKVGTTPLTGEASDFLGHFAFPGLNAKGTQAGKVIVPNNTALGLWSYPTGGDASRTLGKAFIFVVAAAVSRK